MPESDAGQFRRQMLATLLGALLGISGSVGTTLMQDIRQSRQLRTQERVDALSQFGASLSTQLGTQIRWWHLSIRMSAIAARAERIAAKPDLTKQDVAHDYANLINDSWAVISDIASAYNERAKAEAALTAAFYRLRAAFPDVPDFPNSPLDEQLQLVGTMPEMPEQVSLRQMATSYARWSASYKAQAEGFGKLINQWNARLLELRQKIDQ